MLSRERRQFFLRWLSNPLRIGAPLPSSADLARAMAEQISATPHEYVLELGPGTGVVTHALLEAGLAPERLITIERDHRFAAQTRSRFPHIQVIEGDARHARELLHARGISQVAAVVSSLPLLSMPDAVRHAIVHSAFSVIRPDGTFIQYTYGLLSPVPKHHQRSIGIRGRAAKHVWHNFPPARIWHYKAAPASV